MNLAKKVMHEEQFVDKVMQVKSNPMTRTFGGKIAEKALEVGVGAMSAIR